MTATRTVTIERDLPFPPDRVWRALTEPHLIAEWLMQSNFAPEMGHRFSFAADWGAVACDVLEIEPGRRLTDSWVGLGLDSTVTWSLTPTATGTHLRMEQAGFRKDQQANIKGATAGWREFLDRLAEVLARGEDAVGGRT